MSIAKQAIELSEEIALITLYAPDEYPERLQMTFATHKADIQGLWSQVRPGLKQDAEKIEAINQQLEEMFTAFEQGDKAKGQKLAWDLWNLPIRNLR